MTNTDPIPATEMERTAVLLVKLSLASAFKEIVASPIPDVSVTDSHSGIFLILQVVLEVILTVAELLFCCFNLSSDEATIKVGHCCVTFITFEMEENTSCPEILINAIRGASDIFAVEVSVIAPLFVPEIWLAVSHSSELVTIQLISETMLNAV